METPTRVLYVQFTDEGWPFTLFFETLSDRGTVGYDCYDVEYSRAADELLVYCSGGGGNPLTVDFSPMVNVDPWWAPADALVRADERTGHHERLDRLPEAWPETALLQLIREHVTEAPPVYCDICRDWYDGGPLRVCDHVWWCEDRCEWGDEPEIDDGCNHWTGPGYTDPCHHIRITSLLGDGRASLGWTWAV